MKETKPHGIHFLPYVVILVAYVSLRILNLTYIVEPKLYPDSKTYLDIATRPLTSASFLGAETPITTPLIYKILGGDPQSITLFQTGLSIIAWVFLAATISRSIHFGGYKVIAFAVILMFSLSGAIILWDWVILSESIAVSLMALLVASWLWFGLESEWKWNKAMVVMMIGGMWIFTRDTNALVGLTIAGFVLIAVVLSRADIRYLSFTSFFIVLYILSFTSANAGGRWIGPNLNVISQKILTDPKNIKFYSDHGMPVTPALTNLAGERARPVDAGFDDSSELREFHEWHRKNGKIVYLKYLLSDPVNLLFSPIQNIPAMVKTGPLFWYAPKGFRSILPLPLDQTMFFNTWTWIPAVIFIISFGAGIVCAICQWDRRWMVPAMLFLLLYPHAFIIWHGASPQALSRHAYQFSVHIRLSMLMVIVYTVDVIGETMLPKYVPALAKYHWTLIGIGSIAALISLLIDLFIPGNGRLSIGYAQGFGIIVGLIFLIIGLKLRSIHLSNNTER